MLYRRACEASATHIEGEVQEQDDYGFCRNGNVR